ncbi:MAG: PspC domain-containing protein [Oscillospiraceae bacterium]|nr:PspC domain-containing protein [Oscillospiraceae bacterium]
MNFNGKRLYKKRGGMICGVCAGLAEYLDVDVTIVRLIWAICFFTGIGFLAYIAASLIMPFEDEIR